MNNLPLRWPISFVILCRRRKNIVPTVASDENSNTTTEIRTMNHGSRKIFCFSLRCWCESSKSPEPDGWARGGVTKWLGSIVNGVCHMHEFNSFIQWKKKSNDEHDIHSKSGDLIKVTIVRIYRLWKWSSTNTCIRHNTYIIRGTGGQIIQHYRHCGCVQCHLRKNFTHIASFHLNNTNAKI